MRPGPMRDAVSEALRHLNASRGRGDIDSWIMVTPTTGVAYRVYRFHNSDSFQFSVTEKEDPGRVTVKALGSTRTELWLKPWAVV